MLRARICCEYDPFSKFQVYKCVLLNIPFCMLKIKPAECSSEQVNKCKAFEKISEEQRNYINADSTFV